MRRLALVLALAACKIPDVTFIKGDGGSVGDGGIDPRGCAHGIGYPSVPWPVIGPGITALAFGDLDDDGITDLAVAAGSDGDYAMHVLHGNGNGTFSKLRKTKLDVQATSIVLAGLTGDSRLSIVTANRLANSVSVLLNDEQHKFTSVSYYPTGKLPVAVAAAKIRNKTDVDIVTADSGDKTISVLPNNGNGTFGKAAPTNLPDTPSAMVVADLDHDSKGTPDIAVTTVGPGGGVAELRTLFNSGGGAFGAPADVGAVGVGASTIVAADLDGDGALDLAVDNYISGTATLYYGNGTGSFGDVDASLAYPGLSAFAASALGPDAPRALIAINSEGVHVLSPQSRHTFTQISTSMAGNGPVGVAVAPIKPPPTTDAPPSPTMIATANTYDGTIAVVLAGADGKQVAPASYEVGDTPMYALVAGLRSEGPPDLVISNNSSGSISIVRDGETPKTLLIGDGNTQPTGLAALDFDADGALDVAVADNKNPTLHLLRNTGGSLTEQLTQNVTLTMPARALATGQLGVDAKPTLVVADASELLFRQAGGPNMTTLSLASGSQPNAIAIANLDGERGLDIAVTDAGRSAITLLTANATDGFDSDAGATLSIPMGNASGVAAAPLKPGATLADLVVTTVGPPALYIFRRTPNGGWTAPARIETVGLAPQSPVIADVNGDGALDVLYTNRNGATLAVLLGNGDGTLADEVDYGTGIIPGNLAVADVNGDGAADIVVPHGANGVSVLTAACLP